MVSLALRDLIVRANKMSSSCVDDILRARLKTIGVTEHALHIDTRGSVPKDWLVYDVGGSRTQRAAWMPYFDASDAIIFIANVAGFDQTLAEDRSMNRMVSYAFHDSDIPVPRSFPTIRHVTVPFGNQWLAACFKSPLCLRV